MEELQPNEKGYHVHIKQFDGPLDLLLYLIEKAEVDIREVFISEITSEFLSYLSELDELDMDMASSFISVAATLVYMKSRSLMPKPRRDDEEEQEEEDPGEALIRQLREYKAFREAAQDMRTLYNEAAAMRTRLPMEFPLPPREIILKDTTVEGLYQALLVALNRAPDDEKKENVRNVAADKYTIRSCTRNIREALKQKGGRVMFLPLMQGKGKMEIIVTFMALLEMLRRGEISLRQQKSFGDIAIEEAKLIADDTDIDYDDEGE